ncbi:TetR/AcrR family transcriptional regulator [Sphingobium boeckii]|uniref:AcrR family transcriptional regulator n=1 Tax=Sphingobium boeckii TaxID=1082345 RepID=A0A7W9AI51_9SPHN|nr:TetR/AcrR family transcriptional regulator [Sphingobium boeckii]MBB5685916.1 AcrR family transcriptional regulator [Sphingobium boeckii]
MNVSSRIRVREDPVVRRAQIIEEGIRLIGLHGYNGFTVQALATRCGISNAGLLYYFGSKDALLLAFLAELERQDRELLEPLVARAIGRGDAPSSRTVVIALLRTVASRFTESPALGRFAVMLQCESIDPSHPAHDWFLSRETMAFDMFVSLVTGLTPDPQSTARQLVALMNGLAQQWLRADRPFDLEIEWEKAVTAILPALFEDESDSNRI